MQTKNIASENIRCFVRIKPNNCDQNLLSSTPQTIIVGKGAQQYEFDEIFNENAQNFNIFQRTMMPIIQHNFHGYNSCILAYGQTASGKTFTMKGQNSQAGIIPLTVRQIFKRILENDLTAQVRVSYIQIYNQNIIDLLNEQNNSYLQMREDCKKNITITNLIQQKVQCQDEAMKLFQMGEQKRKFATTGVNFASSRSHTIFRIMMKVVHNSLEITKSYLNMVDLAGSQGVSRTKAEGSIKKQGDNINKSLLALSNVIRGMSQKCDYINFRDSKLTRILQNSLCTNSKSIVICTINPSLVNMPQIINTLKFGVSASKVNVSTKQNTSIYSQSQQQLQQKSGNKGNLQNEQIQLVEYKKKIDYLKNQNAILKKESKDLQIKLSQEQFEYHRVLKQFQDYKVQMQVVDRNSNELYYIQKEQKQLYEQEINKLKYSIEILADKYDVLKDYNDQIEKNEKYLLNKIAQYEHQLTMLKDSIQVQPEKPSKSTWKKPNIPKIEKEPQIPCPLTIGTIITLSARLIGMKKQLHKNCKEIANFSEEQLHLEEKIKKLQEKEEKRNINFVCQPRDERQVRSLHRKLNRCKHQLSSSQRREQKLINVIKNNSKHRIKDLDLFDEWLESKTEKEEGQKMEIQKKRENEKLFKIQEKQNQENNY